MGFNSLGLNAKILQGVAAVGYTEPTPIQLRAIPAALKGGDLIASAQTGTGKTAAFVLPTLSRLEDHKPFPRCLVLTPTRELAAQVETAVRDYGRFTSMTAVVIFGGTGYHKQIEGLRNGPDVIVATPGRLLDHLQQGNVRLNQIEILIMDEADRMLDMGFLPDVRHIAEKCPRQRQTMLFSATIPPELEHLCKWALRNPEIIEIGANRTPATTVTHALYPVADAQKTDLLLELLKRTNFDQVLIFARTRHGADRIFKMLRKENHSVAVLHSDRTQMERERSISGFRNGKYEILVATDIASRGIDIGGISHVINYDVPQHPEDYVHRIGRTGRALAVGDAFTIMVAEDITHIRAIERYIAQKLPRVKLENFPYLFTRAFEAEQPMRGKLVRAGSGYSTSGVGRRRRR